MTPEGWRTAALASLGELIKARGGTKKDSEESGVPVIRYGELYKHHDSVIRRFFSFIGEEKTAAYTPLLPGDLLFAGSGETLEDIGRSAAFLGPVPAYAGGDLVVLRPSAPIDPVFLGYASNGPTAVAYKRRVGRGSSVFHIHAAELAALPLCLPPLGEQKKIAAILSSVDEAIESTQGVIDQLDVVKKALMAELLTRGIPGRHTKFKMTEIGEVPEEWDVARLDSVAQIVRGSTPRPARDPRYFNGDHVPWLTVAEITKDDWPFLLRTSTMLTAEGSKFSRFLSPGTLVLSNSGVTLGVPKILEIGACANDGVAAFLDVAPHVDRLYLYYHLRAMTEDLRTSVARGVGQPNLNTELIGELRVRLPSLAEQRELAGAWFALDERIRDEAEQLHALTSLKQALLAVLLTGEVRVKLDEDAQA